MPLGGAAHDNQAGGLLGSALAFGPDGLRVAFHHGCFIG
jgi:hypothetical protein